MPDAPAPTRTGSDYDISLHATSMPIITPLPPQSAEVYRLPRRFAQIRHADAHARYFGYRYRPPRIPDFPLLAFVAASRPLAHTIAARRPTPERPENTSA